MPGPLSGVRVLDLTGPFATIFLADQGSDVLQIEPIGGDITRPKPRHNRQGRRVSLGMRRPAAGANESTCLTQTSVRIKLKPSLSKAAGEGPGLGIARRSAVGGYRVVMEKRNARANSLAGRDGESNRGESECAFPEL